MVYFLSQVGLKKLNFKPHIFINKYKNIYKYTLGFVHTVRHSINILICSIIIKNWIFGVKMYISLSDSTDALLRVALIDFPVMMRER